ncbi:MAG: CRISPR system precrRNA processing endoribonuclease RAMP protein Cas6 [Promethearchaeota archaeon]
MEREIDYPSRRDWRPYPLPDSKKLGVAPAIFQFEFHFVPVDGRVPSRRVPYGHVFRAKFFEWLSGISPELVEVFHSPQRSRFDSAIRPYAIGRRVEYEGNRGRGPGRGGYGRRNDRSVLRVLFSLNVFDEALGRSFAQYLFRELSWEAEFGPHKYYLEKIQFHQLAPVHFTEHARPVGKFLVRFLTPTSFRSLAHAHDYRFPDPVTLFTNVAHLWNTTFPENAAVDEVGLREWVMTHVMASSYKLRTVTAEIGKARPLVGFVGWCNYLVRGVDRNAPSEEDLGWCSWIDALGRLAELSNLGHNRTAAMGVCQFRADEFIS